MATASSTISDPSETKDTSTATSPLSESPAYSKKSLSAKERQKIELIHKACRDRDLKALAELASTDGGLVDDEVRRTAWPLLLGSDQDQHEWNNNDWKSLPRHRDEDQVELDVHRSFVYYPENESETRMLSRKHELSNLITSILRLHPSLCYFQGYHDILQVLLLVLGADAAGPAAARLSLLRIRDFMLPTLAGAEAHLHLLPAILHSADVELYEHLAGATQPTPFFALAATLTLYAHDIEEYGDIARLFDYLLASEAAVPVYLFATIIITRKKELLAIPPDEPEMLHSILSKLPQPLNLESLISTSRTLFTTYPPSHLPFRTWRRISSHSVLKTTQCPPRDLAEQSLKEGEREFDLHAREIEREEKRKLQLQRFRALAYKYRKPVRWTGAAVLVAVVALYFGSGSGSVGLLRSGGTWDAVLGLRQWLVAKLR